MSIGKKITSIVWVIALISLSAVLWFISADKTHIECISNLPYEREYYIEYLAPCIIVGINKMFSCILLIVGLIFAIYVCIVCEIREGDDKQHKNTDVAINIMYFVTTIALLGYTLACYLLLKSVSWLSVICGVISLVGIAIIIKNIIRGRKEKSQSQGKAPVVGLLVATFIMVLGWTTTAVYYVPRINQIAEGIKELYRDYTTCKIYVCFATRYEDFSTYTPYVKVQFVNLMSDSGRQYTVEELTESFHNFWYEDGSWLTLWQFCEDSIHIELDIETDEDLKYDDSADYPFMDVYLFRYELLQSYGEINHSAEGYIYEGYRYEDAIYFGGCVERLLNSQGLTLVKLNSDYNSPAAIAAAEKYEEAELSDIDEACIKVAEELK